MAMYKVIVTDKEGDRILENNMRCPIREVVAFIKKGKETVPDAKVQVWRLLRVKPKL